MTELDGAVHERIAHTIATELGVRLTQVRAAVALLDQGATVPFIARYRKEATEGLDDEQLRSLQEQLSYARELEQRRAVIIASIRDQGVLTEQLAQLLDQADNKQRLEDLYLPYRPKRRTRAQAAREAGLTPLADALFSDPSQDPETLARSYVDAAKGIADTKAALDGARDILSERFSENADMLEQLRTFLWQRADLVARVIEDKRETEPAAKFRDYFDFAEPIGQIPSHRALAMFRGQQEGILTLRMLLDEQSEALPVHPCQQRIADFFGMKSLERPADAWLRSVARWTWRVKCLPSLEGELFMRVKNQAQEQAIGIFGTNLKDLLLAAPAGHKGVIGLDPGIRTGVKVAVISQTGAVLDTAVIFPHEPRRQWDQSIAVLAELAGRHGSQLISIGNGTASRETDQLAADLIARHPELHLTKVVVSEAGASVYSASALASQEFPDMDVSYRGAVSIARRLQDPLAELVKIDPKAIGVGQYQHDVNQTELARKLDAVVEDCVNAVGVDVNTASAALLGRVSGISGLQARAIVNHRDENGPFEDRQSLLGVSRMGPKTFELAAGFLRIPDGKNRLDASAVHPESYPVVQRIEKQTRLSVDQLIGNSPILRQLKARDFVDSSFGIPTIEDIFRELEKPGRDPRPEFKTARFSETVRTIADLKVGMQLEGVVTNVAAFGAFVDIGVHQDGLVHVSEVADRFVRDPREITKVGDIVQVRVVDVDAVRRRIALSMRTRSREAGVPSGQSRKARTSSVPGNMTAPQGALANAFAKIKLTH